MSDYYQSVVAAYLNAKRSLFLKTECMIQIAPGKSPPKGTSWYVDLVALDLKAEHAYLCEVSYAASLSDLINRLTQWNQHWHKVQQALYTDCGIPHQWPIQPWVFVPQRRVGLLSRVIPTTMPVPLVTALEATQPWSYAWDRTADAFVRFPTP